MNTLEELVDEVLQELLPKKLNGVPGTVRRKIIRDAVWGMIELLPHEHLIVDTPLFQRLRRITQTGFTYLVYPCAVHSRFEHSIGVAHIAGRMLNSIRQHFTDHDSGQVSRGEECVVRLAALLHDISHCIFSHVSEDIYDQDPRVTEKKASIRELFPPNRRSASIGAAEVVAFTILTSPRFEGFFNEVRRLVGSDQLPDDVRPIDVARMIVGLPPEQHLDRSYLTQVVNGPFDADKLDYQARDGYFTGIAFRVDVDRLLSSVCVVKDSEGNFFLAVDHRGVAAIEQLLFNRMLLYDSVYHHHKNRSAVRYFKNVVLDAKLLNLEWLLSHDEGDFFAKVDLTAHAHDLADNLRTRRLPHRAAVIHPATVNVDSDNSDWGRMVQKYFSRDPRDRQQVEEWIGEIRKDVALSLSIAESSVYLDLPTPPKYQELQRLTFIQYSGRDPFLLEEIFPFTSAVNSYAQQCKYRIYLFAWHDDRVSVAAAAFKAFKTRGVVLNEEAFRLAKLNPEDVARAVGEAIPKRSVRA